MDRYTFEAGRADAYERDSTRRTLKALDELQGATLERYGYG